MKKQKKQKNNDKAIEEIKAIITSIPDNNRLYVCGMAVGEKGLELFEITRNCDVVSKVGFHAIMQENAANKEKHVRAAKVIADVNTPVAKQPQPQVREINPIVG